LNANRKPDRLHEDILFAFEVGNKVRFALLTECVSAHGRHAAEQTFLLYSPAHKHIPSDFLGVFLVAERLPHVNQHPDTSHHATPLLDGGDSRFHFATTPQLINLLWKLLPQSTSQDRQLSITAMQFEHTPSLDADIGGCFDVTTLCTRAAVTCDVIDSAPQLPKTKAQPKAKARSKSSSVGISAAVDGLLSSSPSVPTVSRPMSGGHVPEESPQHEFMAVLADDEGLGYGGIEDVVQALMTGIHDDTANAEDDDQGDTPDVEEDQMELAPREWKGTMPPELTYHLFEGDLERLMDSMEAATALVPQLETVGIKTVLNGPTCWPSDGNHLVGPSHEKPNYWNACAESYGIAHGAGLGRYLVHWMVHGEPPYELMEADPARYGAWATKEWVQDKVKEAYGWNNFTAYFNENRPRARPVICEDRPQQNIVEALKSRGAQFGFSHGWETPNWFHSEAKDLKNEMASFNRPAYWNSAVKSECESIINHAGLCYWPFAHYRITGAGAAEFLNRLIANKLPAVGRVGLGHLITPTGKVWSELTFVRLADDDFYVTGYSGYQLHDLRWMKEQLKADEQVDIEDVTSKRAVLFINGPKSEEIVSKVLDSPVDLARTEFKAFQWRKLGMAGADVIAVRMSFIGEHGLELHCERDQVANIFQKLHEADPKLADWGGSAMTSFRLEKSVPLFGKDITKDHNAFEAGLDRFIKLDKGDFIGRDALVEVKEKGLTRKLVQMEVMVGEDQVDAFGNESIRCPETNEVVGFTTSGAYGCLTGKSIALGYVYGSERWVGGTKLKVDLLGKQYDLQVLDKAPMAPAAVRDRQAAKAAAAAATATSA